MTINAFTDGACRIGNPGLCSCAWVIYRGKDEGDFMGYYLGPKLHTNNYAEYMGLIYLLEWAYERGVRNLIIHCDSKLVVNQVNQKWAVNSEELRPLMSKAYGLLVEGCHVLNHVKGHDGVEGNVRADAICNEVLDKYLEDKNESSDKMLLAGVQARS